MRSCGVHPRTNSMDILKSKTLGSVWKIHNWNLSHTCLGPEFARAKWVDIGCIMLRRGKILEWTHVSIDWFQDNAKYDIIEVVNISATRNSHQPTLNSFLHIHLLKCNTLPLYIINITTSLTWKPSYPNIKYVVINVALGNIFEGKFYGRFAYMYIYIF